MRITLKTIGSKKKRFANAVVLVLLIAGILAACAPPPVEEPTPVPPTQTPVPPTATSVPPTPTAAVDPAYYQGQPVAVVPTGEPGQPMVTAAYNTTIRGGPGTNYVVYGSFVGGSTATATGVSEDGQWYVISVPVAPGGMGWVSAAYALPENTEGLPLVPAPPVPPTVELVPPEAGDPQVQALTEVYVRNGPGQQYPAYGIALTGATARVIGKSQDGQWWTVRLNPENVGLGYGWVSAGYVQASNTESVPVVAAPDEGEPVELPPPASGGPTATAIDYVNVRSGPGTNYYILGVAAPGQTGEVSGVSEDGAWWQVKVPTNISADGLAWVSGGWVTTVNTDGVPVVAAPPPPPTTVEPAPPPANQCVLVAQDPADYTTFPTSYGFGMTWVVQNTSDSAWGEGEVDLVFLGAIDGQRLHQNYDLYDITKTVQPGENYTISGGLITPPNPGQYGEAWALRQGSENILCSFWIIVNVE